MTDEPVDGAAEAKAAFHLRMRARGVRDLAVLRAFELVPRQTFVPEACRALALRDLALPIACGQTLDEPWLVARMIEALDLRPTHRVLQIGAGTGYATAILAQLAGEVTGYERYPSLAAAAEARLAALGVANAKIQWGDGLAADGTFDRVIVHGLLTNVSPAVDRLAAHGLLVAGRPAAVGQQVMRIARTEAALVETAVCPCRLQPIARGLAGVL